MKKQCTSCSSGFVRSHVILIYTSFKKGSYGPRVLITNLFVAFPRVVTSTGPGGFMVVCVFYDGNSQRHNGKCVFYGEAENQTCDPLFTMHMLIPYTMAAYTGNFDKQ